MPDELLPFAVRDERPLRVLYVDINAYFASVEQAEDPSLRGRPVGVCAVMADSSVIIAASYEAKRFGVKTGTRIGDAKAMCPGIVLLGGKHPMYAKYHARILEAIESVLPVEKVCSIDEAYCRLIGQERDPAEAERLGRDIKKAIQERVAPNITCSVGIAPNRFLAKLGTDLQKPDGLVVIQAKDLPERLFGLRTTEFAGINRRMEARLQAAGIFSSDDMVRASRAELNRAFGSIAGERWWYMLRGYDLDAPEHERKTLGHSHVLPPELRTEAGVREVLLRLAQKAAARLRSVDLWATHMSVYVSGQKRSWSAKSKLPPTQDSITITERILELWEKRDFSGPCACGLAFDELVERQAVTPSLFDPTEERSELSRAIDGVNQRFGKNKVFLAGMVHAREAATEKIAFNKTWLFSEGKGDNEWEDEGSRPSLDDPDR